MIIVLFYTDVSLFKLIHYYINYFLTRGHGVEPSAISYNVAMSVSDRAERWDGALGLLEELRWLNLAFG